MATGDLIALVYAAWDDLERVINGLSVEDAIRTPEGQSAIAWSVAHITNQVDSWLNVRFAGHIPNPILATLALGTGAAGRAGDWDGVLRAMNDAHGAAQAYLQSLPDGALDRRVPYDGGYQLLRQTGLNLRYALASIVTHHYFHIGEIATKRNQMGHRVGDDLFGLTNYIQP